MSAQLDKKDLFKSTLILGFITFLSRILGFARDMLFAKYFGTTSAMEAFIVAFRVPNFMRRLFIEGSISQVLVPSLSKQSTHQRLNYLFRQLITLIGGISLIVAFLGFIFASIWISIFAPGFYNEPSKFALSKSLLQVMFPYVFFISLSALFSALLNRFERFFLPAFMPIVLNLCMILFILYASYFNSPIYAIAWSVLIAGILQTLLFIPAILYLKISLIPLIRKPSYCIKRILKRLLPGIIGASVVQISLLLDTIFASFLKTGSLSWLYYPDRLNQFPLGILGIALAIAILPKLSNRSITHVQFKQIVNWGIKLSLVITIPAACGMCVLSYPILTTLFQYGKFTAFDVIQSQRAFISFGIGLITFVLIKVLISALYAKHHTKVALKIGVFCILFNVISNIILISILNTHELGYLALAISTTLTAVINAALLFYALYRYSHFQLEPAFFALIIKVLLASLIMSAVLYLVKGESSLWLHADFMQRVTRLVWLIILGIACYFMSIFLLGIRVRDFKNH